MLFKQAIFAAAAAAFLIVPQIPLPGEETFSSLPVPEPVALTPTHDLLLSQTLEVPCKECRGRNTNLKLDFTVEDGKRLLLNDFELYPHADPWHGDLVTTAVRANGREMKRRLGYNLLIVPRAYDEDQQLELIDVVFRILEVGNRLVSKVPAVRLSLVKTTSGEIVMGSIQLVETADAACASTWCRVKASLNNALKGVKGLSGCGQIKAHGQGQGQAHGHGHGDGEHGHHEHGSKPEGHRHHDMPHHSSKSHNWARLLRNIISHIVLPVVVGVAAGVGVAFFGIFVCGVVYRLATMFRGRLPPSHAADCPNGRVTSRSLTAEQEKARLMQDEEAQDSELPPYKDDVKQ